MRLLAVGDVCGEKGIEAVEKYLPLIKSEKSIDAVIINGENSSSKNGITKQTVELLLNLGADVVTGGNHTLRNHEVYDYLDSCDFVLRPHNLTDATTGKGYCLVDFGRFTMAVINLLGKIYLERTPANNPFLAADELIEKAKSDGANIIVVDFHAEATSEKRAMGFYLDGKVSAVFGTHTHVQTADEQILEGGTGYITDLGMTGPGDSVLGVKKEIIINRLRDNDMSKFEFSDSAPVFCGCIFEIDTKTGKTVSVERINIKR